MVHFLRTGNNNNNDNSNDGDDGDGGGLEAFDYLEMAINVWHSPLFAKPEYEECQIDGMMFWVLFPVDVLILAFAHVPYSGMS